jgi:hypothetical protein
VPKFLVQNCVQKDAFGATCNFFMILGNLRIFCKFRKFQWSGHHPPSTGHVPRGYNDIVPRGGSCFMYIFCDPHSCVISYVAIHAIVIFVGPGFDALTTQHNFLWVLGSIPRPGCLFLARMIRGLCHSPPRLKNYVGLW